MSESSWFPSTNKLTTEKHCYVMEEYEVQLELYPAALDHLNGKMVECEGGGYNESEKYGNKAKLLIDRVNAEKQAVSNKWKSERMMIARPYFIHIDKNRTPRTYNDIKGAIFGPDGLSLTHNSPRPCRWLDGFFHTFTSNELSYTKSNNKLPRRNEILKNEKKRRRYISE